MNLASNLTTVDVTAIVTVLALAHDRGGRSAPCCWSPARR